jgi:rhamnogalacturonan endolyase
MFGKPIHKTLSFILASIVSLGGVLAVPRQRVVAADTPVTTLTATADAYVRSGTYANSNYGTTSQLVSKNDPRYPNNKRMSFFKFDFTEITEISNAKFRFTTQGTAANHVVHVYGINDDSWTEVGITWNNAPNNNTSGYGLTGADITDIGTITNSAATTYEIDVTSFITAQTDKVATFVILTDTSDEVNSDTISSREGTDKPSLVFNATSDTPAPEPTPTPEPTPKPTPGPTTTIGKLPDYQMENLDRGLISAKVSNGVFLSWRLLKNEVTGYTSTGLAGTDFAVYRDGIKIATVTDSTNYIDTTGTDTSKYYIRAIADGVEGAASAEVTPSATPYIDIPMQLPPPATLPNGSTYEYYANDMSVADVDGDGQYEYLVKFQANNPDVIQKGFTANVYIHCYELDGTLKYSIDLGQNIRAGAHYTQYLVADFDGNGKSELMVKTAPGTKSGTGEYITMLPSDIEAGYSNTDDYRSTSESYYEYLVSVFKNWTNHPEVLNGNWPNTLEACFGIETKYSYPLNDTDARALVDYFIDVYAPSRSTNNKLRDFNGFIFTGPEYLTVFNADTGAELKTVAYKPGRDDDGLMWGDYAWARIEPANRVERMGACVAYLDGVKPSAIFSRGYYTRATIVAYDWDGTNLIEQWFVDSGYPVMNNPFNISTTLGRDGRNPEFATITGQGAHTIGSADVDGDGRDEVIQGGFTIDDNGKLLYSSSGPLPNGEIRKIGHGDSIHVTDIIPSRPGLEIFMCHEGGTGAPYGVSLRDAKTGEVIWGEYSGVDTGRCMVGDVNSAPGLEYWGIGLRNGETGTLISEPSPGTNFNLKWQPDMTTATLHGSGTSTPEVKAWNDLNTATTLLTATGTYTNNSTKGTPNLAADVLGDYREELLLRTTDSSSIRIYFNTEESYHKLFTLMNDRQYRTDVARQNDGYNQPAYTSFYYGRDINWQTLAQQLLQDKTALNKAISEANALNADVYTASTWSALQAALVNAEKSVYIEDQATVDNATAELNNAIKELVKRNIDSIRSLMASFEASGELSGPLMVQLVNNLDQAQHQLDKLRPDKAAEAMQNFIKHLNNEALESFVDEKAKEVLNADAQWLINSWLEGSN